MKLASRGLGTGNVSYMKKSEFSRRKVLRALALTGGVGIGAAVLAGCGETQIVEIVKEVPVEKVKEVVKEVPVVEERVVVKEKVVVQEKVITKIVEAMPKAKSAKISLWMQQWDDGVNAMQSGIDSFEAKNPNYKIEMTPIGYSDLLAKFYPAITTETAGEIVYTYTDWWYPIDVTKVLHPITPNLRSRSELRGIFFPAALDAVWSSDGEAYIIPLICGMGGPIFLTDVKAAEEAGIDVATVSDSWQNLEEAFSKSLVKDGDRITRAGFQIHIARVSQWGLAMTQQLGAQYYFPEKEAFDWQQPEVETALTFVSDTLRQNTSRELMKEGGGDSLIKKTTIFDVNGLYRVSGYGNVNPELELIPNAVPAFPGAQELVYESDPIGSLSIPRFVKDEKLDAAYGFLAHIWQPENLAVFGDFYSGSHANRAVYENEYYISSKWGRWGIDLMPNRVWPYISFPPHHVSQMYHQVMSPPLEKVTFDKLPVQDMILEMQDRTNQLNREALDRFKAG